MEQQGLTLVVPVYNERGALDATFDRMRRIKTALGGALEVILVDDGSTDGTEARLASPAAEGFRVIRHPENRGYGAALKTGIAAASHDYVAITDADGTYPDHLVPEFYRAVREGGYDMIVGARTGPNAKIPLVRRPAKWCLSRLANMLCNRRIPDLNSGFRIMRKSVVTRFLNILPDGFSFTTTITLAMLTNGFAVKYVPIEYSRRIGSSKIRPIYDTLNFLQLICRTTLYFNPLRIFVPLALLVLMTAFAVLVLSWIFLEKPMDVTFGILFMTSIMVLAIGLLADLIDKRLQ